MKREKTATAQSLLQCLAQVYLLAMLGGFPFYFRNNYINIVASKKAFFQTATLLFLALAILLGLYGWLQTKGAAERVLHFSAADWCGLAFMAVTAFSCLLSPEGAEAFWGHKGRQMGGLFLLLCMGAYFAISRCYGHRDWVFWLFLSSAALLWIIMICNFWGWDVLGMHSNLKKSQLTHFLGTLGNQNINASYCGVLTSLMLAFFHSAKDERRRRFLWAASVLGVYACHCTSSDSWLLAVGGALLLLLALSMGKQPQMLEWLKCCMAFGCGSLAMGMTTAFAKSSNWKNPFIRRFLKQKLLSAITDVRLALPVTALLLLLFLLLRRKPQAKCMGFLKKYGNWILAACLLLGILAAGLAIFPLEDGFGTNRGYIWKRALWNFQELPAWQKLFGYGPNCFYQSLQGRFGAEMRELFDSPFLDAHNECLQILSITGILGLASYLGMQLCLLRSCLGRYRAMADAPAGNQLYLAGCVGIAAYLLQGLVNNPSIFTLPPYFIFLGILARHLRTLPCQMRAQA